MSENNAITHKALNSERAELWDIMARVFRKGKRAIRRELERISIKPTELKVLESIAKEGDCQMNSIALEINVTGAWITGVVDELERRGLVLKNRSSTDRRIIRVSITDSGKSTLEKAKNVYQGFIKSTLMNLDQDEMNEFRHLLSLIEEGLGT